MRNELEDIHDLLFQLATARIVQGKLKSD